MNNSQKNMSIYKQKQQAVRDRREMVAGWLLGSVLSIGLLVFMVWHWWRVSQWLELPF